MTAATSINWERIAAGASPRVGGSAPVKGKKNSLIADFLGNNTAVGQLGQFAYKAAFNDPNAIDEFDVRGLSDSERARAGVSKGELFEAFDMNNKKIYAREFNMKGGATFYMHNGKKYNTLEEVAAAAGGVNGSWQRASGTSAEEGEQKLWLDDWKSDMGTIDTAKAAMRNLKRSSAQAVSIIEQHKDKMGINVLRGAAQTWLSSLEQATTLDLAFLKGNSVAIGNLNSILKAQLLDLVSAAKAKGATFGAMTEAEWRLLGQQLGEITDTAGGIYAIQKYLHVSSDLEQQLLEEKKNWWRKQKQERNYNNTTGDFEPTGGWDAWEQKFAQARTDAIAEGKRIEAGLNSDGSTGKGELGSKTNPHRPATQADYDAIPSGEWFLDGDGSIKQKR